MTKAWVDTEAGPDGVITEILQLTGDSTSEEFKITALPYPMGEQMVFSVWWKSTTGDSTTADVEVLGHQEQGVTIPTTWERYVHTVPAPSGTDIYIALDEDAEVLICKAQLEIGEKPSDWRQAQEDLEAYTDTQFNIVEGEISSKVSQTDFNALRTKTETVIKQTGSSVDVVVSGTSSFKGIAENNETTVQITDSEFVVNTDVISLNAAGETQHIDETGGTMQDLSVSNYFSAPNVAYQYTGPSVIHVSPNYPSEAAGAPPLEQQYSSLNSVFSEMNNKLITYDVTIYLDATLYESSVNLAGLYGYGDVTITRSNDAISHSVKLGGRINVYNCANYISFEHFYIEASGRDSCLTAWACKNVYINDCKFIGTGDSGSNRCIDVRRGTNLTLVNSVVACAYYLIYGAMSTIYCGTVWGDAGTKYISATGCQIMWYGACPYVGNTSDSSSAGASLTACLTEPSGLAGLTRTMADGTVPTPTPSPEPGPTPTPTPTTQEVTVQLTAQTTGTYRTPSPESANGYWNTSSTSSTPNRIKQGIYDGEYYFGGMWFDLGSQVGKTIQTASLKLTRSGQPNGSTGEVTIKAWPTLLTGKTANPNYFKVGSDVFTLGTLGVGQIKVFSGTGLKYLIQTLLDPTYSTQGGPTCGIIIDAGDSSQVSGKQYSANYCSIEGTGSVDGVADITPVLTVTYIQQNS